MSLGLVLLLAAAAPQSAVLDGLISFENAARCQPGDQFSRFLEGLVRYDKNDHPQPGMVKPPSTLAGAFGTLSYRRKNGWAVVEVPVAGTWHGVPVEQIGIEVPEGGDPWNIVIRFRTEQRTLESVAHEAGLPRNGTVIDDEFYPTSFTISSVPNQLGIVEMRCDIG